MAENEARKRSGPCRPGDPDEEAVARILEGHKAAEELDAKYRAGLVTRAASLLHDRERARTVVEDTLADAFTRIGTFRGGSSFFNWVYSIFRFRLLKEQKAMAFAARREVGFGSESVPGEDRDEDPLQEADWITQIEQALTVGRQHTPEGDHEQRERLLEVVGDIRESLSPQTREVFYLIVAGLSSKEIARVLGTSEANVRNHVNRGREVLKAKRDERSGID